LRAVEVPTITRCLTDNLSEPLRPTKESTLIPNAGKKFNKSK